MGNDDAPGPPDLSLDHQQVLAFIGSYLREFGCLPTPAEVARGCGFRSSRTASRLLGELEARKVLRRDPTYSRLGSIELPSLAPAVSLTDQLWLCERACTEYEASLDGVRAALGFAPDVDAVVALHAEGGSRGTVLQAFHDARRRLVEGGAVLTEENRAALQEQVEVARAAHQLLTDWNAYCVVQLVWNLSARQWLAEIEPIRLGYVGSSFVASLRTIDSLVPTYWARATRPLAEDPRVPTLLLRVTELLDALRQGIARHFPSSPERLRVDVQALLAC